MTILDDDDDDEAWWLSKCGTAIEPADILFSICERDRMRRRLVELWAFFKIPLDDIAARLSISETELIVNYGDEISAAERIWSIERLMQCIYRMRAGDADATLLLVLATNFNRGGIPRLLAP